MKGRASLRRERETRLSVSWDRSVHEFDDIGGHRPLLTVVLSAALGAVNTTCLKTYVDGSGGNYQSPKSRRDGCTRTIQQV